MKKTEPDALTLLKEDHEMVAQLFADFKSAKSDDEKLKVMEKITDALEVHAKVEEEIFYPVLRTARDTHAKSEVREAYEEHKQIKILLAALEDAGR
jgi:iron-sulfur cluster repair protein YtfE (RIC family)